MRLKEIKPPVLPSLEWKGSYEEEVYVASEVGEKLIVGYFVPYRYLYAYTVSPDWKKVLPFIPVGINGLVRKGEHILFGRRGGEVTQFAGYFELPPSGAISRGKEGLDPVQHLLKELKEETGIVKVKAVRPLVQLMNEDLDRVELCFEIEVQEEGETTSEYDKLLWLHQSASLSTIGDKVVPLSRLLFTKYGVR